MARLSAISKRQRRIEWNDEVIGEGAMKTVYFSTDQTYVVQFMKVRPNAETQQRFLEICISKRDALVTPDSIGRYWDRLFCWPYDLLEHNGRIGLVAPAYDGSFFFTRGARDEGAGRISLKGKEKHGRWFATGYHRAMLHPHELGDFRKLLGACLMLSRGVRKMHLMGLAHSDLSYKNVLFDPSSGRAAIIDVDGLVVPGKIPPQVQGTPHFIAPEVVATAHMRGAARKLPNDLTDRHALAVLIYMYLLKRHPLEGSRCLSAEADEDDRLQMGERALWVEDPEDHGNRPDMDNQHKDNRRWQDVSALPYTSLGPFLAPLVSRAFRAGLKDPSIRPRADEWEDALIRSVDLLVKCANLRCEEMWFMLNMRDTDGLNPLPMRAQVCPFCKAEVTGEIPFLNFYTHRRVDGTWKYLSDGRKLVLFNGQELMPWHASAKPEYAPSERLTDEMRKRVGVFQFHQGRWYLRNENMANLKAGAPDALRPVPRGEHVVLAHGMQILLDSPENDGRMAVIQIAGGR